MGQPIFMTETEKQWNDCKISRAVWLEILNRGGEGVDDFGTKLGGSAIWNEGEGFLKLLKK